MENLNTLDLDVFGFGLGTEAQEPTFEEGNESVNLNEQMDQILALCDANEALDSQYAVGLVNGLESVSDSYKLILMTQATSMMDAGVESEEIAGLLNAAGIDCSVYEAGMEAREGGLVQPLRSAGSWAKGTKAYKAVADSWVGKSGAYIIKKIKEAIKWLIECIYGKPKAVVDKTANKIKILAGLNELHHKKESRLAEKIKGLEADLTDKDKQLKAAEEIIKTKAEAAKKAAAEIEKLNKELQNAKDTEVTAEAATPAAEAIIDVEVVNEVVEKATKVIDENISNAKPEEVAQINKATAGAASAERAYISSVRTINRNTTFGSGRTGSKFGAGRKGNTYGAGTTFRKGAGESEEFDVMSMFMIDGTESVNEMFGIEEEFDYDGAMESPELDIALAKYDMMMAVSAGTESMNMDHFGHPYIAVDFASHRIYGVTPGMEAEDLADTKAKADKEAKDGEKKEDKKEGGFGEAMSKAGRWIKGRPHYIAVQFRRFVKWLMSKSTILDSMLTKLALVFSRNVDIKSILTDEKKKTLVNVVSEFTYGIKKASYDIDKITVENFNGEEPKEDAIRKSVEEKLAKLEKVNSSHTASGLDKLGLSDASKELRALRKKLSEKNLEKLVKAEKLTAEKQKEFSATMAQINRSSTRLTVITRNLVTAAKKAAAAEKDSKKEEKPAEAK